jgi:2-C-methyl-D-erythritol 4-phosphate cytidylyltransferase
VKDTIKVVDATGVIESTPNREQLWAAQTPQGFKVDCYNSACRSAIATLGSYRRCCLFEKCGLKVQIVQGEETNLKVTTPMDLSLAEFICVSA